MAISYELIDFESGNLVGSYATEEEAARSCVAPANPKGTTAPSGSG